MRPFKGLAKGFYSIATYIKQEHLERFRSNIQEAGRQAIQEVLKMKEDDILNVPVEKVEEILESAVWKVIYVDRETHERWLAFPRMFKKRLHYWVNQKLSSIEVPAVEKDTEEKATSRGKEALEFYLFGQAYELFKQGFLNSKVVLDCLAEVYEKQNEIRPLRQAEYEQIKKKLGIAGKVRVNFRYNPELREWYVDIPLAKRRGVWVAVHQKILDKLANLLANL